MTHSTLEVQRRLHDLNFFPHQIDGIDGPHTRAAIRSFQLDVGLPASGVLTAATEARLFPHISRIGSLLALMRLLSALKKGDLTMNATLTGYKTYIIGAGMIAAGVAQMLGVFDALGMHTGADPMALIMGGVGLFFARNGSKTEAKKMGL